MTKLVNQDQSQEMEILNPELIRIFKEFIDAYEAEHYEKVSDVMRTSLLGKCDFIFIRSDISSKKRRRNCLEMAARKGNLKLLQVLMENGNFDPNFRDDKGISPYTAAFEHGDCLKYLHSKGGRVLGNEDYVEEFSLQAQRIEILQHNYCGKALDPFQKEKIESLIENLLKV